MNNNDRRYFIFVSLGALLIVLLPVVLAERAAGSEYVFGGVLLNPIDGNSYLAKAYQGWRGSWSFTLPYTAEISGNIYIHFYYVLLGHIARWTGISLPGILNLARVMGAALMMLALWRFFGDQFAGKSDRRAAYTISVLTLGSGWLLLLLGQVPADFWVAEAFPFLASLTNAHFPLALALILMLSMKKDSGSPAAAFLLAVLLAFMLAVVSPFGVVIAMLPWGGLLLWDILDRYRARDFSFVWLKQHAALPQLIAIVLGGIPVVLYDFIAIRADPILSAWDAQNITASPAWWDLLFSFSPALLLALAGFRKAPRMLVAWAILGVTAVFIPHPLQRRLLMGLYIPLAGLAAVGLRSLLANGRVFVHRILIALFIPGTLLLLFSVWTGVNDRHPLLFLTRAEMDALAWVETETDPDAVVLSSTEMGLFIPAYTGRRVVYGHPFETINAEEERKGVEAFYGGLPLGDALTYLEDRGVDYVMVGEREKKLGEIGLGVEFELVFNTEQIRIYRVIR